MSLNKPENIFMEDTQEKIELRFGMSPAEIKAAKEKAKKAKKKFDHKREH